MNILTIDCETTTSNKGNPFDKKNQLVTLHYKIDNGTPVCIYMDNTETQIQEVNILKSLINTADLIVGFAFKFDLHWLRKVGVNLFDTRIFDCQLAEYVLSDQTTMFPSLDGVCEKYGLEKKLDIVRTEYWDKGIDTLDIPKEILEDYGNKDVDLTYQVFQKQQQELGSKKLLHGLLCQDLVVLQEMEWNGLYYNDALCVSRAQELDAQIGEIRSKLNRLYPDVPLNFSSNDHVSAFLYGGEVKWEEREHHGFWENGARKGRPRFTLRHHKVALPRLVTPLPRTELKKKGYFATSEDVLLKLKNKCSYIALLLELSKLEKRNGTYYKGIPKINKVMDWPANEIHGSFHQCLTATGRLSSSKPNQQNFDTTLLDIFESRYLNETHVNV